jgi:23S rRNA (cytosine1962-C5)-methyltransferase
MKHSNILITDPSADYELLDSGDGEKLERFGKVILSRPDPQALWGKKLSVAEWKKADANFVREESQGSWSLKGEALDRWPIELGGLKFLIKPTAFKHVGLFPEQAANWGWLEEQVKNSVSFPRKRESSVEPIKDDSGNTLDSRSPEVATPVDGFRGNDKSDNSENDFEVLNLFGYTGGATLACAKAGAKVVHVDGSKAAIAWARENAELSGLAKMPVRWILDDARAFVSREIKRDRFYDGIIMDPPAFGHGPDNELWKIEENFLPLVEDCFKILKSAANGGPSFFVINGYSAGYSAVAYENILLPLVEKFGGQIEIGELTIKESQGSVQSEKSKVQNSVTEQTDQSRLLPCGIFARWSR